MRPITNSRVASRPCHCFENPIAPVGGIYDPDSRLIAPGLAWRALAGHLNKLGVALFMNSQPQNLVLGDFGVSGFEINDMVVECESVVATDVSFAVAAAAGLGLSIQTVESPARLFVSTPLEPFFGLSMSTLDGQMSYWQAPDGELAIETAGAPGEAALYLLSMVPALASVKTRPVAHHLWSQAADGLPFIGDVAGSGYFISGGWGPSALTIAPVVASLLADRIAGKAFSHEFDQFSPDRFMSNAVRGAHGLATGAASETDGALE